MGNANHPNTGEIGYKSKWNDKDFEEYFKLTDAEIKIYKDFINKFNKRVSEWKK